MSIPRFPRPGNGFDGRCCYPSCDSAATTKVVEPLCDRHLLRCFRSVNALLGYRPEPAEETRAKSGPRPAFSHLATGVVYFVQFADRVKIGFTTDVERRMKGIPHDAVLATIPGTMRDERLLHQAFARLRVTGEWFRNEEPLTSHIESIRSA